MSTERFTTQTELPTSAEQAFTWHERPGALQRLIPPWESLRVVERNGGIRDGDGVTLEMKQGPLKLRWVARHHGYNPPHEFRDTQEKGPFKRWEHIHSFSPAGPERCVLKDDVTYELPAKPIGTLGAGHVRKQLERTFRYRHDTTAADLALHRRFADVPRKKIALTGAGGLIGTALSALLTTGGHEVVRLVRRESRGPDEIEWHADRGVVDPARLAGVDAVIHLAGESIASGRWTEQRKAAIRDSRVVGTRNLVNSIAECNDRPATLLCASAIGYYGDRGEEVLSEHSSAGTNFLADTSHAWEAEANRAADFGVRVVNLRIGVVLSPQGGMLDKLLPIFNVGGGGPVGSGKQWLSWISIDDLIGAIYHTLLTDTLVGPVNLVAPRAVTNEDFSKTLGRVLHRPAVLRAPAFALRLRFGEMADELLLSGARVSPEVLLDGNYVFRHTTLEGALRHLLGRHESSTAPA